MNRIVPIVIFLFAALWVYKGWFEYGFWENGGPGGGFLAVIAGLLCAVLCIIEFIKSDKSFKPAISKRHFIPVIGCFVLILVVQVVGMVISFGLFLIAWLVFVEKYTFKRATVAGLLTAGFIYLLFKVSLQVPLPAGIIGI